ncbi:phosphodiester glycosidase family protein [Phaeobacter sp. QD34_3]|uniref:phosphodiester glycosidase family protein n=1 Tax=unclassified Phaeobacter TaxID=2621772 RepID=UPI00237F97B4|nr:MULTISPECIES: phosphodiester glycosidase family protein [unclassified Phaeobacter]MDE4132401.1 phosphodiester glycosidase family protein [Phaeobacter sp. QD34_3]MDE4136038.1 phosphodiester glycosidase family protein [Phaeobacter sp. QD34_24]
MIFRAASICAALLAGFWASSAAAVECRNASYDGNRYTICEVDAGREELRLFLRAENGKPYGHFTPIEAELAKAGKSLAFATNAGMYHADRSPVGLYVEDGQQEMRLIPNAGPGNFGLLPNGVFCINDSRADVIETLKFRDLGTTCRDATQSGPMLVIDGELHPRFLPGSTSYYVRNGVGTSADGQRAVFVISRNAVTFHQFGSLFRDHLKLPNALYFDGNISRLHAPELGRSDAGFAMGPVVGVVE